MLIVVNILNINELKEIRAFLSINQKQLAELARAIKNIWRFDC